MDCSLLNDGVRQNRNRFRQSDRHTAGSNFIFAALSSGLRQRAFLSAARNDGRTGRPRRTAVLRRTRGCLVRHLRHHEDSKECERLPDRGVICSKQANHPGADFHCAEPARDNSVSSRSQKFRRRTFCPGFCFGNPWIFSLSR